MTDHTRTEKIGGDSIFNFVVNQVVAGNRYDNQLQRWSWKLKLGFNQYTLSVFLIRIKLRKYNLIIYILKINKLI